LCLCGVVAGSACRTEAAFLWCALIVVFLKCAFNSFLGTWAFRLLNLGKGDKADMHSVLMLINDKVKKKLRKASVNL